MRRSGCNRSVRRKPYQHRRNNHVRKLIEKCGFKIPDPKITHFGVRKVVIDPETERAYQLHPTKGWRVARI